MSVAGTPPDLAQWRKGVRAELIARREAVPEATRREWDLAISLKLLHALPARAGAIVGFCWPYRGEYDARFLLRQLRERGMRCALPVVRKRDEALIFRHWEPGVEMKEGVLGIAYPVSTAQVTPDLFLVPLVGFGRHGDRLGYGGGFFDRTLASYARRPLAVGVGYELARIETSFPQLHDVLMDAIVTEAGMWRAVPGGLEEVTATQLRESLQRIEQDRERAARDQADRVT